MTPFGIVAIVAAVCIAAALGILLGRYVFPLTKASDLSTAHADLSSACAERDRLRGVAAELEGRSGRAEEAARTAETESVRLSERLALLSTKMTERDLQLNEAQSERDAAQDAEQEGLRWSGNVL